MPRKAVNSAVRLRSLNLKTTEAVRARLEEAAAKSGCTLTREVEIRLTASFESEVLAARLERIEHLLALFVPQHLANLPVHPIAPFGWTWDEYVARLTSSPGAVVGHINPPGHAANTPDGARGLSIHHVNRRVA